MLRLHVKQNYFEIIFEIISVFYFTCNHVWNWKKNNFSCQRSSKIISKLLWRQRTCRKIFTSCYKPV